MDHPEPWQCRLSDSRHPHRLDATAVPCPPAPNPMNCLQVLMTDSSPRFLYAGGHCSHGAANSDWVIIPTQLCLFYCCSVPNNQLLSPTMPLIKALQRCNNHLSLVINPGFYCPVISQTSVWYFACSPLLIFPQQPGSSRIVRNSCCELLPLLSPLRFNRERSQPMWKAWVPSLC